MDRLATPGAYLRLSLATLALLWLIVVSGALVRLTQSGLGCPDWPHCGGGSVLPPVSGHGAIEFGNRIFSAVVMATAVLSWLAGRRVDWSAGAIPRWSGLVAATTVLQVPLGGLTVYTDLHPLMVATHLMLSMFTIAAGVILVFHAHDRLRGLTRGAGGAVAAFAWMTAVSFAAVLVTGSLTTASGPHSGDRLVTRRIWAIDEAAFVHVRSAIVFLVIAAVLALWLAREGHIRGTVQRVGTLLVPVVALQISIGEYQYRNALPWEVVLAHVSVAALAWALVVALVWNVARPVRTTEDDPQDAVRSDVAGLADPSVPASQR